MRRGQKHPGRSLFFLFVLSTYGAIFLAAPLVNALEPQKQQAAKAGPASAGSSAREQITVAGRPTFEQADRNQDGVLDKSEAGSVPGLSANFERADVNRDGRLDRDEFNRALERPEIHK